MDIEVTFTIKQLIRLSDKKENDVIKDAITIATHNIEKGTIGSVNASIVKE